MTIITDKLYFVSKCILLNDKNEFLILKRTDYKKNGSGNLWDIPGGSVDTGEDVNNAVKREVSEEVQVELLESSIFSIQSSNGTPTGYSIFTLFYSRKYDLKKGIILSEEHSEYKWIPVNEIYNFKWILSKKTLNIISSFLKNL